MTRIAVVGAGPEACRLARLASLAGLTVRLHHPEPAALARAQERIRADVEAQLAAGAIGPADRQRALDGILFTGDLDEAVTHADLVAEVDAPDEAARRAALFRIGQACRASAVIATGGAPDALMDWLAQPGRLVGLRAGPSGPAIVAGVETSPEVREVAQRFARRLAGSLAPGPAGR